MIPFLMLGYNMHVNHKYVCAIMYQDFTSFHQGI